MKSQTQEWIAVNGKVYRLDQIVDSIYDALLQRIFSATCEVHLERADNGRWVVY